MNPLNYATLEACQRLQAAGIVLETDSLWILGFDGKYSAVHCATEVMMKVVKKRSGNIPAPSMAEVWRELPPYSCITKGKDGDHHCWNYDLQGGSTHNANSTDALIDLLIWVTEQRKEKV